MIENFLHKTKKVKGDFGIFFKKIKNGVDFRRYRVFNEML
jgi:hypothetical protein